jgi:hypothetical protein
MAADISMYLSFSLLLYNTVTTTVNLTVGGLCQIGGYCPAGSGTAVLCPIGTYGPSTGKDAVDDCIVCDAVSVYSIIEHYMMIAHAVLDELAIPTRYSQLLDYATVVADTTLHASIAHSSVSACSKCHSYTTWTLSAACI